MKLLYSPLGQSRKPSRTTDTILGLLLAVGLVQIALCVAATSQLVPSTSRIYSAMDSPSLETNATFLPDVSAKHVEKSQSFLFVPHRV